MRVVNTILVVAALALASLSASFAQTVWDGTTVNTSWYTDSTSVSTYTITKAEELAGLASLVNTNTQRFSGKTIILGNDIWLNDTINWNSWDSITSPANSWTAIGRSGSSYNFQGTFDGNHHTVLGVYIDTTIAYQGLFGHTSSAAVIKNTGSAAFYVRGGISVGGLVGYNYGTISNCYTSGNVFSDADNARAGNIAGYNYGNIYNSYALGTLTLTGLNIYLGGITGINYGDVSNCYAAVTILKGQSRTGGIVGSNSGTVSNCVHNTTLNPSWSGVGQNSSTVTNVVGQTTAQMQTATLKDDLNLQVGIFNGSAPAVLWLGWEWSAGVNNGYPYHGTTPIILTCPQPANIVFSSIATTTAEVSWTARGSETQWNVIVSDTAVIDFSSYGTPDIITSNDTSLTGLTDGTKYFVYVRAYCDVNDQSYWTESSFYTLAIPAVLPYLCDFEENNPKWIFENGTQTNQWHIGTATHNGGAKSLYISYDNGVSNMYTDTTSYAFAYRTLEIPAAGTYEYSFDWKCYGEPPAYAYFRAFLVPDSITLTAGSNNGINVTGAPTGWISLDDDDAIFGASNPIWQTQAGDIHISDAGNYNLVFYWENDPADYNNPPVAIDNIIISQPVSCPSPKDIVFDNITATTTEVSWTARGSETQWNIIVSDTIITDFSSYGTLDIITSSDTALNGLTAETTYYVYIRAYCDQDDQSYWAERLLRTAVDCSVPVSTFPWIEDFEDFENFNTTTCWTSQNVDANSLTWEYMPGMSHNGISSAAHGNYCDIQEGWLITPQLIIPADGNYVLKFWSYNGNASSYNNGKNSVLVSTASNDLNDFTEVWTPDLADVQAAWVETLIYLTAFAGDSIYIGFKYEGDCSHYWFIDDVEISNCEDETPVAATICQGDNYTDDNFDLTAPLTGIYRDTLANIYGCDSIIVLDLTVLPLETPIAATICLGDDYPFGGSNLTEAGVYRDTLTNVLGCDSIIILTLTVESLPEVYLGKDTSIEKGKSITLDAGAGFSSYLWSTGETKQSITVKGEQVGTITVWVNVYTTNNCMGNDTIKIECTPVSIATWEEDNISVYPNPVSNTLTITGYSEDVKEIKLYNAEGKLILTKAVNNTTTLIDMQEQSAGVYFLHLNNKEGKGSVKKIVKK